MDIHPPVDPAQVLLKRFGDWDFPVLVGNHQHADAAPGRHGLESRGLRSSDAIAADRSANDARHSGAPDRGGRAKARSTLIKDDLLFEFMFDDDGGVSRAVALSAIISTVCRGAFPVVPMHIIDAPAAGSGKSYLLSTVSRIATGHPMPVLGAGKTEEELEKRLGPRSFTASRWSALTTSSSELGGDALCRLVEQPRPSVRDPRANPRLSRSTPAASRYLCQRQQRRHRRRSVPPGDPIAPRSADGAAGAAGVQGRTRGHWSWPIAASTSPPA